MIPGLPSNGSARMPKASAPIRTEWARTATAPAPTSQPSWHCSPATPDARNCGCNHSSTPITDYGLAGDSYEKYANGYGILTRGAMVWFRDHYLRSPEDAKDWRASPIKAASLAGVAPAMGI